MIINPAKQWRDTKKLHKYLNKEGKLLVWTQIHTAPSGFEYQTPYFVGIVEFEDGERLPVQIVDCEEKDLSINAKVIAIIRRLRKPGPQDIIEYGIKVALHS